MPTYPSPFGASPAEPGFGASPVAPAPPAVFARVKGLAQANGYNGVAERAVLVLGLVIVLGAFVYFMSNGQRPGATAPNWLPLPAERYASLVRAYGEPTVADMRSGGMAWWRGEALQESVFTDIRVEDVEIPHCCPSPHMDFLSAAVCIDLDTPSQVISALGISQSVWYDQLQRKLWARCHAMSANVATLLLATVLALGEAPSDVDVSSVYGRMIGESTSSAAVHRSMVTALRGNLSRLKCTGPAPCHGVAKCENVFQAPAQPTTPVGQPSAAPQPQAGASSGVAGRATTYGRSVPLQMPRVASTPARNAVLGGAPAAEPPLRQEAPTPMPSNAPGGVDDASGPQPYSSATNLGYSA